MEIDFTVDFCRFDSAEVDPLHHTITYENEMNPMIWNEDEWKKI